MPGKPLVLLYHGFGTRDPHRDPHNLFVPAGDLERHLRLLTRAFRPLSLDAYARGWERGRWPRRSFLVTIDDGYVSTLDVAAPLFARYGVPAVLFVPPTRLGGTSSWMPEMPDEPLLAPDRLRELAGFGVEIGVHGMDHSRLPGLPEDELRRQVTEAREAVADLTGRVPTAFAYPEGLFDSAAVREVRRAGYRVAFSVHQGGRGRFDVVRRPVDAKDATATFMVKLLPGFNRLYRASATHPRIRRAAAWVARQRR